MAKPGTRKFEKTVMEWHKEVASDFQEQFGKDVFQYCANVIFVRNGDKDEFGKGALSWIGDVPVMVDLMGHMMRELTRLAVQHGDMTVEEAGQSLMKEIAEVAQLKGVEVTETTETPMENEQKDPRPSNKPRFLNPNNM